MVFGEYDYFLYKIKTLTGLDLKAYKGRLMERRLRALMNRMHVDSFVALARVLEREPERLEEFKNWVTINVSEFFRNPERFAELERNILPELCKSRRNLKIWSAGCSNGSEPYSVAIILRELGSPCSHHILGTDVDTEALNAAREGLYSPAELRNVNERLLATYFRPEGEGYRIIPEIRRMVTFSQHNLLSDPYPSGFDLILCRNVIIYFTNEIKNEVLRKFHESLKPGGVLFIGGTESIQDSRAMGFEPISPFFYRKVASKVS